MAKKSASINESIFYALKNSETSGVPVLLIGSAGTGKSTTVEMFAELRGYELLLLRGSTASEQEIMGFMSVHQGEKEVTATNVLPTWFLKMKEYQKQGKKTLLFLDEITAVNPYVQAALLHLIFERKVNEEKIPDDCLIVSAGNYSGNLTNEFELLSPVVNRFCVFNITPDESSLDEFLKVYDGASVGKTRDIMKEKSDTLALMDSQKVTLSDTDKKRVGCYFETAIRETTRALMTSGEKPLSFKCTDTQSVYKSQENDELLLGFVSLRTLSYLTRMTMAAYENFGVEGVKGSNFKRILEGLVGVALTRRNGEVIKTKVSDNYYQSLVQTLSSISKLSNSKIKEYEEFFAKMVLPKGSKEKLDIKEITVLSDKLTEMANDKEIKDVTKPLEDEIILKFFDLLSYNADKIVKMKISPSADISSVLSQEKLTGMITNWNYLFDLTKQVKNIVTSSSNSYTKEVTSKMPDFEKSMIDTQTRLSSYVKLASKNFPEFANLLPKMHTN